MFQFPGCPLYILYIQMSVTGVCPAGFPHSDICGSRPTCGSPQLFAAGHVLLRQMVPWHPPCALLCLISFLPLPSLSKLPLPDHPETISFISSPVCPRFSVPLPRSSRFRFPSPLRLSPSTGLPEKLVSLPLCSCQGSGRFLFRFSVFRADPENDTASKFLRQSVLFALFLSASFRIPIDLGFVFHLPASDFSLERR